jgi:predicted transcriptional regulator
MVRGMFVAEAGSTPGTTSEARLVESCGRVQRAARPAFDSRVEDLYAGTVEVRLNPELERKLNELAAQSGRPAGELVSDAVAGYVDELAETRAMLDSRYDDIRSGQAELAPGDEVFARVREKSKARRDNPAA